MPDNERLIDVCVVGGGPAGLAVAEALIGSRRRVCVVEAGAAAGDPQMGVDVELLAENPYPGAKMGSSRASMVGGTAGLWSFRLAGSGDDAEAAEAGCRYVPLDPLDLVERADIGTPGWPLTRAALDPWYQAAHKTCQLGPFDYDVANWVDAECQPLPLEGTGVVSSMSQFGPATAFTRDARQRLEKAPNIDLRTRTTASWLQLDGSGEHVIGVRLVDADGAEEVLPCAAVVLAAGTLENVRLMLDTGREHQTTPGNRYGLVGRYFMEHPLVRGGLLVTSPAAGLIRRLGLYATRHARSTWASAKLTLTEQVMLDEGLGGCSALLIPRHRSFGGSGAQALARLRSPSGRRLAKGTQAKLALTVLTDAPSVIGAVRAVRGTQPNLDRATWAGPNADLNLSVFEVVHQTEQSPQADNRLELTPTRDRYGRSAMALTWRWSDADQDRVKRSRNLFANAFETAGLGTLVQRDWDKGRPRMIGGTHHHLGGLRMATRPEDGVVDADCRVHGTDNLFVAGSAVFPSGGYANPTLTVIALALRLGNWLREAPLLDR